MALPIGADERIKTSRQRLDDLKTWRYPSLEPVGDVVMTTEAGTVVESIRTRSGTKYLICNGGFSDCVGRPEFLAEAVIKIEEIVTEYTLLRLVVGDG